MLEKITEGMGIASEFLNIIQQDSIINPILYYLFETKDSKLYFTYTKW